MEMDYDDSNSSNIDDREDDNSSNDEHGDYNIDDDDDGSIDFPLFKMDHEFTEIKRKAKKKDSNKFLFKNKVHNVLSKTADCAGDFAVCGKLDKTPPVVISLKNASADGFIKFPINDNEIEKIVGYFERSPYGKGTETIVDLSVRNSWQLAPEGFEILNSDWNTFVNGEVASRVQKELSLEYLFQLKMHKLLMYAPGSFFKPHRDSEKEDEMFATLIIQLPSKYEGGQLIVRHDGKTKIVDFSSSQSQNNEFSNFFTAFYCDCEHEVLPVTEGYRFCFVYNMISQGSFPPPRNRALEMELMAVLKNWTTPTKLIYALKHKYSESNLSIENLKTTDRGVANIIKNVAIASNLHVYIAILSKDGVLNFTGSYNMGYDFYNLKNLVSVVGSELPTSAYFKADFDREVIPDDCFDNISSYQETCKPTGNQGIEIRKCYRSAAVVFWPDKCLFPILKCGSGIPDNIVEDSLMVKVNQYDDKMTAAIMTCTQEILATGCNCSGDRLIEVLIKFHEVKLFQHWSRHFINFYKTNYSGRSFPETMTCLIKVCESYGGWHILSDLMIEMFKNVSKNDVIINLNSLFRNKNKENINQRNSQRILQGILAIKTTYISEEDQDLLHSICLMAEMIEFDFLEFAKTQRPENFIPVLIQFKKSLCEFWTNVATYFVDEVIKESQEKEMLLTKLQSML